MNISTIIFDRNILTYTNSLRILLCKSLIILIQYYLSMILKYLSKWSRNGVFLMHMKILIFKRDIGVSNKIRHTHYKHFGY